MQVKKPTILWKRGALWLAFLGPFFFLSYGWLNHLTSTRSDVGVVVEAWEHAIPFLPWLMLPYMSIDAFYAASLFLFRKRGALDRHALRLLLATVISLIGFWIYPLQFSFAVPRAEGFNGMLQAVLQGFDKPYNQAPSLHISLLIVLWHLYVKKLVGWAKIALHIWFAAIAASVLLVYQHHFIDIWTGAIVGVACLYLIPDRPSWWRWCMPSAIMQSLGLRYLFVAILLILAALLLLDFSRIFSILLMWVALALCLVAAAYFGLQRHIFQRQKGLISWPAKLLLAPYLFGSWLSYRFYTRQSQPNQIDGNVWLGAFPKYNDDKNKQFISVLDMTNEFARPSHESNKIKYLPVMDLTPPSPKILVMAVQWLDVAEQKGATLVHCALGLSRSASVVVCWLVWRKKVESIELAIEKVSAQRAGLVLSKAHLENISKALNILKASAY
jgi:protein-tyrosine phosphatase